MDIPHPKRILVLGSSDSGVNELVQSLTSITNISVTDTTTPSTVPNPRPQPASAASSTITDIPEIPQSLTLSTKYYTATIPLWTDTYSSLSSWTAEFKQPEAKEVVDALGAVILCLRVASSLDSSSGQDRTATSLTDEHEVALEAVRDVLRTHAAGSDNEYDGIDGAGPACFAVRMPPQSLPSSSTSNLTRPSNLTHTSDPPLTTNGASEDNEHDDGHWEEACITTNFEYIDFSATETNAYGEKVGLQRLIEGLEAVDWSSHHDGLSGREDDDEFNVDDLDFDFDGVDGGGDEFDFLGLGVDAQGLRERLMGDGGGGSGGGEDHGIALEAETAGKSGENETMDPSHQAAQVDALDRMMGKLMAVREHSADLPEAERKRVAKRAVREVLGAQMGGS